MHYQWQEVENKIVNANMTAIHSSLDYMYIYVSVISDALVSAEHHTILHQWQGVLLANGMA